MQQRRRKQEKWGTLFQNIFVQQRQERGENQYFIFMKLNEKKCIPCQGGIPALGSVEIKEYQKEIPLWEVEKNHHLVRVFTFKSYKEAIHFTNSTANLAEEEQHHPDIYLTWGRVEVKIWTHKINGLSISDFILASKIDQI